MHHIIDWIRTFASYWYPARCSVCSAYGSVICVSCVKKILQPEFISIDGFHACVPYRNTYVRAQLLLIKRFPSHHIARMCAQLLALRLKSLLAELKNVHLAVISLPRTKKNVQEFGHDQTVLIAREFIKILRSHDYSAQLYARALTNLGIKTQHSLKTKTEREQASRNKFVLTRSIPPKDYTVILIDDVITSGSSMRAARDLFTQHGYSSIICAGILLKD